MTFTVDDMAAALDENASGPVASDTPSEPEPSESEGAEAAPPDDDEGDEPADDDGQGPESDDLDDEGADEGEGEPEDDDDAEEAKKAKGEEEKPARSGYQRMKRKVAKLEEEKTSIEQERDSLFEVKRDIESKAHQALDIAKTESQRADEMETENQALSEEVRALRALIDREGLSGEAPEPRASKTPRERELEAELNMLRTQQAGLTREQQWAQQQAEAARQQALQRDVEGQVAQVKQLSDTFGVSMQDIAALSKLRGISFEESAKRLALIESAPAKAQAQANSGAPRPKTARGAPRTKITGTSIEDMEMYLAQRGG